MPIRLDSSITLKVFVQQPFLLLQIFNEFVEMLKEYIIFSEYVESFGINHYLRVLLFKCR